MKERIIELSVNNRKEVVVLPVNPATVELSSKQLNQVVTLLNVGEANMKGENGLAHTELASFFPSERSPFYKYAKKTPDKYVAQISKWKKEKLVVRVLVTDLKINMAMLIDEFKYSADEGDKDIDYKISLSEYPTLNVPSTKSKKKKVTRPKKSKKKTHTVVKGDTLWGIAKKEYGNGNKYTKIYSANKDTIEASAKEHGRKSSDNGHWIYAGDVYNIPE